MKKILFLFSFLFILFSCDTEQNKTAEATAKLNSQFNVFTGATLSYIDDEVVISVSDSKIMETFKVFVKENNLKIEPLYHKIETIDGKDYLRFYCKDNFVSTVDLVQTNTVEGKIITGKTVCTSQSCATGGGCVPNGDYCTACVPSSVQPGSGLTGDCTRSTSN